MSPFRVNPHVAQLPPYVPGERAPERGGIKLNSNENPYPPSPTVTDVFRAFTSEGARVYADPHCVELRHAIGERLGFEPARVKVGNGADELLRVIAHTFAKAGDRVGMLEPTYSLYPLLCQMFGLETQLFPVDFRGRLEVEPDLTDIAIFYIANPNPPYGTWYEPDWIDQLAVKYENCMMVVDEAYVDFTPGDCLELARRRENVIVTRTFSKSYSLAGIHVGFALGAERAMGLMNPVHDPYNVNAICQEAALAAWNDEAYFKESVRRINESRERVLPALAALGYEVSDSVGNFLFARHPQAREIYQQLKAKGLLVRFFDYPPLDTGVRISIGTDAQLDQLLEQLVELNKQL